MLDLQGVVLVWNPATEAVTGWSADEVVGRNFPAIRRRYRETFEHILKMAAQGRSIVGEELRGIKKDGTRIRIQFASSPVHNTAGEVTGILITFVNHRRVNDASSGS